MNKLLLIVLVVAIGTGCKDKTANSDDQKNMSETVTPADNNDTKPGDWKVLFDGTSFDGWKGYNQEGIPDSWIIEDGAMVLEPPESRPEGANYNLVTNDEYTDFVLSLEWRISEGGNSGFFWGIQEDEKYKEPYETGPEIQILDNAKHPDAKVGTTHQAGSLYDMVGPDKDVTKPVGEWNTCVLTVDHKAKEGSVVLNGEEIVTFPVGDEMWNVMVSKSKFADWEGFGKVTSGKIGLQDHGDGVAFRNIKIKEL